MYSGPLYSFRVIKVHSPVRGRIFVRLFIWPLDADYFGCFILFSAPYIGVARSGSDRWVDRLLLVQWRCSGCQWQ